mmetsp:Transcript_74387/g.240602  ORF Transcript_74387/g.240602 Transcript_74387/m.240602 type:complete len:238 (+) Transcript_74387:117-830(+)
MQPLASGERAGHEAICDRRSPAGGNFAATAYGAFASMARTALRVLAPRQGLGAPRAASAAPAGPCTSCGAWRYPREVPITCRCGGHADRRRGSCRGVGERRRACLAGCPAAAVRQGQRAVVAPGRRFRPRRASQSAVLAAAGAPRHRPRCCADGGGDVRTAGVFRLRSPAPASLQRLHAHVRPREARAAAARRPRCRRADRVLELRAWPARHVAAAVLVLEGRRPRGRVLPARAANA